jgi:hypothetical protein
MAPLNADSGRGTVEQPNYIAEQFVAEPDSPPQTFS